MFTQKSFEIFKIEGLEPRMTKIRSEIQPVFSEIGQKLLTELSVNPEAQEVADNTAISEIINRLSDKEVLKYKGKSISSDDIICYIAGGDK